MYSESESPSKEAIVADWLPRYTGTPLEDFGPYILLTNFHTYLESLSRRHGVEIKGLDKPMQTATVDDITMINFGMGSAMAATVMDLLSALLPKATLFLGKCGSLKSKVKVGDWILPIAGIRGEGTSNDYFGPEIPALPSFRLQRAVSSTIVAHGNDYWTGTVYTTNRRVWEHDDKFKAYLKGTRAMAIDMETATLFIVGFANAIPHGALLLVSDEPMMPEGIKTAASDRSVTKSYADLHVQMGFDALCELSKSGESVKHLRFE
jgi:AMP nucleosidase